MAINILLGTTGDGKTYTAVKDWIIPSIKEERKVITNIPLNEEYFKKQFPELDIDSLIEIRKDLNGNPYDAFKTAEDFQDENWVNKKGNKPLVVVDEAHFCLSSDRPAKELKPIEDFFALHRQMGYDIVLLTQTTQRFSRRTLGLVKHFYHCSKLSVIGQPNRYALRIKEDGNKKSQNIHQEIRKYDPSIFPYYKSHALSDGEVVESVDKNAKSIFKKWPFRILTFVFPVVIAILIYNDMFTFNVFSSSEDVLSKSKDLKNLENNSSDNNIPSQSTSNVVNTNKKIKSLNEELDHLKSKNKDLASALEEVSSHPFTDSNIVIQGSTWSPKNQQFFSFTAKVEGPNGDFQTTSKSLKKIGFEITFIDSCLYKWEFNKFNGYWTCGSPYKEERAHETIKL